MKSNTREIERCRDELLEMLERPENRYCAECGMGQPTWASTNIGVFVCIRCSGIHRNLGTHISKVKSTTLDSWTYKLVQHFKAQGGNVAVNSRYESRLPKQDKPNESTNPYQLEQFIRTKYDAKKWFESKAEPSKKQNKDLKGNSKKSKKSKKVNSSPSELPATNRKNKDSKTPENPILKKSSDKNVPDLLPVNVLESSNQPEELLKFENESNAIQGESQKKGFEGLLDIRNGNKGTAYSGNVANTFAFLTIGGTNDQTRNSNGNTNKTLDFSSITSAKPERKGKDSKRENSTQDIDILDEPTATSAKDSILAMYKKQPMLQRMDSENSTAFMTQLPPNFNALRTNVNMRPMGVQPQMSGLNTTCFNGNLATQQPLNPYTILSNKTGPSLF